MDLIVNFCFMKIDLALKYVHIARRFHYKMK
jgi:hypothetical protein